MTYIFNNNYKNLENRHNSCHLVLVFESNLCKRTAVKWLWKHKANS